METILVVTASPKEEKQLNIAKEFRLMRENLHPASGYRIELLPDIAFNQLKTYVINYRPSIIHFSGHGSENGEMIFNENGKSNPISVEDFKYEIDFLQKETNNCIKCIILNACHAESQIYSLSKKLDYIIGTTDNISDNLAIEFTHRFYKFLFRDKLTINQSFNWTKHELRKFFNNDLPIILKGNKVLGSSFLDEKIGDSLTIKNLKIIQKELEEMIKEVEKELLPLRYKPLADWLKKNETAISKEIVKKVKLDSKVLSIEFSDSFCYLLDLMHGSFVVDDLTMLCHAKKFVHKEFNSNIYVKALIYFKRMIPDEKFEGGSSFLNLMIDELILELS